MFLPIAHDRIRPIPLLKNKAIIKTILPTAIFAINQSLGQHRNVVRKSCIIRSVVKADIIEAGVINKTNPGTMSVSARRKLRDWDI